MQALVFPYLLGSASKTACCVGWQSARKQTLRLALPSGRVSDGSLRRKRQEAGEERLGVSRLRHWLGGRPGPMVKWVTKARRARAGSRTWWAGSRILQTTARWEAFFSQIFPSEFPCHYLGELWKFAVVHCITIICCKPSKDPMAPSGFCPWGWSLR